MKRNKEREIGVRNTDFFNLKKRLKASSFGWDQTFAKEECVQTLGVSESSI